MGRSGIGRMLKAVMGMAALLRLRASRVVAVLRMCNLTTEAQ
jgi:hypothetical protein